MRAAGGLAELVDASVGIAVERGGSEDFAEAIAALFADDRAARRRAARARAEGYDWERVLPGLLAHYRSLLRGQAGRAGDAAALPAAPLGTTR